MKKSSMKTSLKPGNKEATMSSGGGRSMKVPVPKHPMAKAVKVHDHKKEIKMADQCKSVYHNEDGEDGY